MLGVDRFLHAGVMAPLYDWDSPFLLSPEQTGGVRRAIAVGVRDQLVPHGAHGRGPKGLGYPVRAPTEDPGAFGL